MPRHYLTEYVIVNVDDVTKYAERVAASVKAPEAKAWFAKKLRGHILNDDSILDQVPAAEISKDMPPYVLQAAENNEAIFSFSPVSPKVLGTRFDTRVEHIKDFFDSLHDTVSAPDNTDNPVEVEHKVVAKKMLSKIQKMTLPQVEAAHELWSTRSGRQVKNMSKEGCEVVITFANGFYWVRYTDKDTMRRDGEDLQNCLRNGNYWSDVQNGSQSVYGLRTSSSEAVVGVRVTNGSNPTINECKGKNNKPSLPEYIPYIIDLLKKIGVKNMIGDLKSAGVHLNNGKYGTFEDIADVVYDKDRTKIMKVDDEDGGVRYLIKVQRVQFWATAKDNVILTLIGIETLKIADIITGVTALGPLEMASGERNRLAELGIFPSEKGYGPIDEVGVTVWTGLAEQDRAVTALKDGSGYLFMFRNDVATRFSVSKHIIHSLPRTANSEFLRYAIPAFAAAKVRLSIDLDRKEMWPIGLVATKTGYQPIDTISKVVNNINDSELTKVVVPTPLKSTLYFLNHNGQYVTFSVNKLVTISNQDLIMSRNERDRRTLAGALQFIAKSSNLYGYESATGDISNLGLFHDTKGELKSELADVLALINDPKNNAKYDSLCEFADRGHFNSTLLTAFHSLRDENGVLLPKVQAKLFNALKPSKNELIKILNKDQWTGVGNTKIQSLTLTMADMLHHIADHLPEYTEQIKSITDAQTTALEILVKKNGNTALYTLRYNSSGWGSRVIWGRILQDANHYTEKNLLEIGRRAHEDQSVDPAKLADDHFALMNHTRRSTIR